MNIGIDIRSLIDEKRSGVGQYTENILHAIFTYDKNNNYFLFYNSWRKPKNIPHFDYPNVEIIYRRYPNKIMHGLMMICHFPKLDKLFKNIDILWVPGNNFITWSSKVRKMITCHDLSWKVLPKFFSNKGKFWHRLIHIDKLFKQADVILAVSEYTKNEIIRNYPHCQNKIVVTPLGVKRTIIQESEIADIKKKYKLPNKYILYLGDIEPRKNLNLVIETWEIIKDKYPDIYLIVAGGRGWHNGYYNSIISKLKNIERTKYLGYINEDDKFIVYKLANIFFWPSFYEGFGLPPLEAMSQGSPVVVSNVTSLPEVVGSSGILVDPYNVNQAVYALESLLNDEKLRSDMINKGLAKADQYSWEKTAQQMIEIFNEIII